MTRVLDLKDERFGRLVAVEIVGKAKNGARQWRCRCDCGNETIATSSNLRSGSTLSCGCLRHEGQSKSSYSHGLSGHRLHGIWRGIKGRCGNLNNVGYKDYGGRGISICDEWKNDFMAFYNWAMQNGYDDNLSIDRIDVNGNYCPENCRWVDEHVQNNNKRTSHYLEIDGKKMTVSEWSRLSGVNRKTIIDRINKFGYSPKDAVFMEPMKCGKRRDKKDNSHERRAG